MLKATRKKTQNDKEMEDVEHKIDMLSEIVAKYRKNVSEYWKLSHKWNVRKLLSLIKLKLKQFKEGNMS